ncbi:hypothetical protein [Streptomyces exfoliatus]|uniref:hypothetical protein n=1 Tax=Streptomyces exfoliatus TaxID=1905 RepID=UPI003C2D9C7B
MAAALVLALTGCEESVPAAGGGKASGAPGKDLQGAVDPSRPPVSLDPTGLMNALPIESQVGDVMVGGDPFLAQGNDAVEYCVDEESIDCVDVDAVAGKDMEERGDSSDTRVEFRLYSFETVEQAKAAMKAQVDDWRKADAKSGGRWQQKTVDSGADETEAVRDDEADVDVVVMRLGTVVSHIVALDVLPDNVRHAAVVQASQVQAAAMVGSGGH